MLVLAFHFGKFSIAYSKRGDASAEGDFDVGNIALAQIQWDTISGTTLRSEIYSKEGFKWFRV